MNDTHGKLEGIADIQPPPVPLDSSADMIALALLVVTLVLMAGFAYWRRRRSLRGQARRKLARLQAACSGQERDRHYTAFQLAAIVRIGLGLQQLSRSTPLPAAIQHQSQRWNSFIDKLYSARYSRAGSDTKTFNALYREAAFWLRHWP